MQFMNLVPLFLAGLAIASPVEKRTTSATVFTDLGSIATDIATLDADAKALTGTLTQCLAIYSSLTGLESVESTTVTDTKAVTWTVADSNTAVSKLTNITASLVTLLDDFDAKYSVLAAAGYAEFVGVFFKTFATDTDAVYTEFIAALTNGTSVVTSLKATVDAAFATTEGIYA